MMKAKQTETAPELFRNLSTTREFLLSRADGDPGKESTCAASFAGSDLLTTRFPDLLAGRALIESAMDALDAAAQFSVMVIRMDGCDPDRNPPEPQPEMMPLDVAEAVHDLSLPERGIWGQLGPHEFGCFFAGKTSTFCLNLSQKIKQRLAAGGDQTVTIGIAAFPTITYEPVQILNNAYKALAHAAFFGPDSTVCFDSTSLNISGDKLYQQGDIRGAIKEFKLALLIDPANVNVYNSLGVCYGVLGRLDQALDEFKIAISLDPDEVMALYNAGLVCALSGDRETALEYLLAAGSINADLFEVVFHTGKLYVEMGNPKKGQAFLERAVNMRPDSGPAFRYMGECYAAVNMTGKAVTAFTRAVKLNPNDAPSLSALGHLYALQDKDLEIALAFCRQSVRISPANGLFRYRLAVLYHKQNRLEDALREFTRASELGHDTADHIDRIQTRLNAGAM